MRERLLQRTLANAGLGMFPNFSIVNVGVLESLFHSFKES